MVASVDPDVLTREPVRHLHSDDAEDSANLMHAVWTVVRAGRFRDAVRVLGEAGQVSGGEGGGWGCGVASLPLNPHCPCRHACRQADRHPHPAFVSSVFKLLPLAPPQPWRAATLLACGPHGPTPLGAAADALTSESLTRDSDTAAAAAEDVIDEVLGDEVGMQRRGLWRFACREVAESARARLASAGEGAATGESYPCLTSSCNPMHSHRSCLLHPPATTPHPATTAPAPASQHTRPCPCSPQRRLSAPTPRRLLCTECWPGRHSTLWRTE